jgi:hypothetical protein
MLAETNAEFDVESKKLDKSQHEIKQLGIQKLEIFFPKTVIYRQ